MNTQWYAHSTDMGYWDITAEEDGNGVSIAHVFTSEEDARRITLVPDIYELVAQFEQAVSGLEKPMRTTFEHLLLSFDKLTAQIKARKNCMTAFRKELTMEQAWVRLRDNEHAKRAIEIALAGNHTVMAVGREGDGKELLDTILGRQVRFIEPCPCGNNMNQFAECICTPSDIIRYRSTLRFRRALDADIRLELVTPKASLRYDSEPFSAVYRRVKMTRENAFPDGVTEDAIRLYQHACTRLAFTEKQQDAVQRVAKTIAKMDGRKKIEGSHMAEAIQYQILR